jgi:branched-chain amino acid transport system substrate-binding protein
VRAVCFDRALVPAPRESSGDRLIRRAALVAVVAFATLAPSNAARAERAPAIVRIGFTGPLSGAAATYGDDVRRGIGLAIDQIDARGGIVVGGKRVAFELVALDDGYRAIDAARNARRLVRDGRTPVVFCPESDGIYALRAFNETAPKFVVGAYSNDPAVARQGDAALVTIPPSYDAYFAPWAELEMKRFGKRLAFLPTAGAYGDAWKRGFGAAWTAAGGSVVADDTVDYAGTGDFSSVVELALASRPDVMLVGGPAAATARAIGAARAQGFRGGFVLLDDARLTDVAAAIPLAQLEGTVGAAPLESAGGPGLAAFLGAYRKAYGAARPPTPEVAFDYVAMCLIAHAMELANSTSDVAAIVGKLGDAVKSLRKEEQPIALDGVSKAGHLRWTFASDVVEAGMLRPVH